MTRAESIAALLNSLDDAQAHGRSLHGVVDLWLAHLEREEVARLNALVKDAEWGDGNDRGPFCPWCGALHGEQPHADDCPAFTPSGDVR